MDKSIHLRSALNKGDKGVGMWLTFPGTPLARTIASVPGFNWFLIDAEHGQITDKDFYELCNAIASEGISPIIRIPIDEGWWIKRALDSGAHGIMTPMCSSAEAARRIVSASKFSPRGIRGFGSPFTHHNFAGVSAADYKVQANDALLVVVQIETKEGLENVEEIAAVNGIDMLFVGPFDLSLSLNVEFGSKEHEDAIARILKACQDKQKISSIFCTSGAQARARLAQGFEVVSIATDTDTLTSGFARHVADARGQGEAVKIPGYGGATH